MRQVSLHEDLQRVQVTSGSSDRSFGIVFCIFFVLVGLAPLRRHYPVRWWALALGAAFLIVALARPAWLAPLNRVWTGIGVLMGRVVSPLVTAFLFYIVVTPMGILFRLLKKDPLHLRADPGAPTYWIIRQPPGPPPESMPNQF